MAGKVLSIEVGYSFTKVCEMDYQSKKPKIYNNFVLPTPDGILADGLLMVDDGFVLAFKELLSRNKIKTKAAVFTISSSKIASREVKIPYCKENRIGDLVRSNLQDYFPIDVSQYSVAYSILEKEGVTTDEFDDEKKKKPTGYKLLLLAVPFQILEGYRQFASAVGLDVKEIDYNGNSVYQAAKEACAEGTQMLVKIDERSSLILVEKDGMIVLNRTIPYGIDTMISAISETNSWGNFGSYKSALDLSMKKSCILTRFYRADAVATPVPGAEGYAVETEVEQLTPLKKDKIAVTNSLSSLVGGISKVVDYYNANHSEEPIERMLITGVGADILGIDKLLSNEIGFQIDKLVNIAGLSIEKNFKDGNFSEYVACIGAAMAPVHFSSDRDSEKGKSKRKSDADTTRIAILISAGCILVALVLIVVSLVPYLSEKKKETEYNAIIEELQPVYEVYLNYLTFAEQAKQMELLDKQTVNRNQELVAFIETLEQKMPASFMLNDLDTTKEEVTMNVTVASKEEAAAVLEELRKLEMFAFVDTTALSELVTEIGEIQYTFTVEMQYAPIVEETVEGEE